MGLLFAGFEGVASSFSGPALAALRGSFSSFVSLLCSHLRDPSYPVDYKLMIAHALAYSWKPEDSDILASSQLFSGLVQLESDIEAVLESKFARQQQSRSQTVEGKENGLESLSSPFCLFFVWFFLVFCFVSSSLLLFCSSGHAIFHLCFSFLSCQCCISDTGPS